MDGGTVLDGRWADFGPFVTGATGGSGTRVVARLERRGGLFIGSDLNESEDAVIFGAYSDRWINPYLRRANVLRRLSVRKRMVEDLQHTLLTHLQPLGGIPRPWGWKEPRSIFLLPFWSSRFPKLRFLHIVRDGRDMAYSSNQNQLRKHGHMLLDPDESGLPEVLRSMALWAKINLRAAEFGERELQERYMRIRFEDLCENPKQTASLILGFFGLEADAAEIAPREVTPPPDALGRWKSLGTAAEMGGLNRIGEVALRKFGYEAPVAGS